MDTCIDVELRRLTHFVKHIERSVLEGASALTPHQVQDVVQFNIQTKLILEQLTHLLLSHEMTLGRLFELVAQYSGMYAMYVEQEDATCFVSGDRCSRGRFVVLCEKLQPNTPTSASFSFFIREDIFKYVRFFYFLRHFNFYVTRLVVDTTYDDRWGTDEFVHDLHRKYQCATLHLMNLLVPLESQ